MFKFKVGDKVKYTFNDGRIMYGIVEEIRSNYHNYYPYYVYYDKDNKRNTLNIYDWESDDTIEWVEECTPVGDDAKFRAFLNEVLYKPYGLYNGTYYMVEELMQNNTLDEEDAEYYINKLCDFYETFEPVPKKIVKEMTIEEIEKELGYAIKVVE